MCHCCVWPTTRSHSIQGLVRLSQWRHQNYLVRFRKRPLKVTASNFVHSGEVLWMKQSTDLNLSSSSCNICPWDLSLLSPSCTALSCTWVLFTPQWGILWHSHTVIKWITRSINCISGGTGLVLSKWPSIEISLAALGRHHAWQPLPFVYECAREWAAVSCTVKHLEWSVAWSGISQFLSTFGSYNQMQLHECHLKMHSYAKSSCLVSRLTADCLYVEQPFTIFAFGHGQTTQPISIQVYWHLNTNVRCLPECHCVYQMCHVNFELMHSWAVG